MSEHRGDRRSIAGTGPATGGAAAMKLGPIEGESALRGLDPDESIDAPQAFYLRAWLQRQCQSVQNLYGGLVIAAEPGRSPIVARWPLEIEGDAEIRRCAERALQQNRAVYAWTNRPEGLLGLVLGVSLQVPQHAAIVSVAVGVDLPGGIGSIDPECLANQLRNGAGWLELQAYRHKTAPLEQRAARAAFALDIVAVASAHRRVRQSTTAVVNELAGALACSRVSLGLVRRGGHVRLAAMSGTATFQERSRVADGIETAMEECLLQHQPVGWPALAQHTAPIAVAHRDLARLAKLPCVVLSVALAGTPDPCGVITFEWADREALDPSVIALARVVGGLVGPVIDLQRSSDRLVSGRGVDLSGDAVNALLGPRHLGIKLASLMAMTSLVATSLIQSDYRVTGQAVLEGRIQRSIVAPFDGFIAASNIRPGDRVAKGDVLATLDDRDLQLERARAHADVERLRQKFDEAMSKHDRANVAIIQTQIDQAEAQQALAEEKLGHARVTAPIDGLVVAGDLSQLLGSPIERGKSLFELAPLNDYRVAIRVDERELRQLEIGQHGRLVISGMPLDIRDVTIDRITPIAEAKDGKNEFRIEARLNEIPSPEMRPGMEGVVKIATHRHALIWNWGHGLIDWLRLAAWKWVP